MEIDHETGGSRTLETVVVQPRIAGIARRPLEAPDRLVASLDHGLEGLPLVRHVALDGLDQVRDQVATALELDLDLGEAVLIAVLEGDQGCRGKLRASASAPSGGERSCATGPIAAGPPLADVASARIAASLWPEDHQGTMRAGIGAPMGNLASRFLHDKLISHGWQMPVRALVSLQDLTQRYTPMSQEGQDDILLGILEHKRNGSFVDLGGSNGVTSSNTYLLEKKYGWTGVCIEANPRFYRQLVRNRRCWTVNAVVADSERSVQFNDDGCTGHIDETGRSVQALPLARILDDLAFPSTIDYLSLDVEGFEEEVLIAFPFDRYRFRVMSIERPSDALHEKLLSIGYDLHTRIAPNGFWLDNIYVDPSLV